MDWEKVDTQERDIEQGRLLWFMARVDAAVKAGGRINISAAAYIQI